jgi:hypothetical protein
MTSAVRHPVQMRNSQTQSHRSTFASRTRRGREGLQNLQLVPLRQHLELERDARPHESSEGEERQE